jgi:uncharacterized protein YjdB
MDNYPPLKNPQKSIDIIRRILYSETVYFRGVRSRPQIGRLKGGRAVKRQFSLWFLACIVAALVAGCGCGGDEGGPAAATVTLVAIQVTPATTNLAPGATQQFKATGVYSDNTTKDITASASWSSADSSVATVSDAEGSKGLATAHAAGSTFISATSGGIVGSATITVTPALASISVTPAGATIAPGATLQFTATGTFTDNSTKDITALVNWSASVTTIASVSNDPASKGLAAGLAAGSTAITATSGNISGSATLTVSQVTPPTPTLVSIQVTPANPSVMLGATQQFTATGTYSDGTTKDITILATWSSSPSSVASISNAEGAKGLATSLTVGTATITATSGNVSGSTTLTVKASLVSITVTPANHIAHFGDTVQYTAIGVYADKTTSDLTTVVTWSSSDTSIAVISNATGSKGLATADHKLGTTVITATLGNISGSTNLIDP